MSMLFPECAPGPTTRRVIFSLGQPPWQELSRSLQDMAMHFKDVRLRLQRPEFLASTLLAPVLTKYTMDDECKRAAFRHGWSWFDLLVSY